MTFEIDRDEIQRKKRDENKVKNVALEMYQRNKIGADDSEAKLQKTKILQQYTNKKSINIELQQQ